MPCTEDRKTEDFSQREKKNRVKGKEKRLERKQSEKERKLKKKEESWFKEHAPIDRLPFLPLQKSHLFPENANENFPSGTITIQGRLPQSH